MLLLWCANAQHGAWVKFVPNFQLKSFECIRHHAFFSIVYWICILILSRYSESWPKDTTTKYFWKYGEFISTFLTRQLFMFILAGEGAEQSPQFVQFPEIATKLLSSLRGRTSNEKSYLVNDYFVMLPNILCRGFMTNSLSADSQFIFHICHILLPVVPWY